MIPITLKTNYKNKRMWAEHDGYDQIEIYKTQEDIELSVMTINLKTDLVFYYLNKHSPAPPDVHSYKLVLNGKIYDHFQIVKED